MRKSVLNLLTAPRPNVFFEPAWRWNRVARLAEKAAYLPRSVKRSHPLLYRAFHFCRRFKGANGLAIDPREMATRDLDLHAAIKIFDDPHAIRVRWLLEAFLMAGKGPVKIAEWMPIRQKVVAAYESLFFDIRDLLKYPAYIYTSVLGSLDNGVGMQDQGLLLKLIAYMGGADMLLHFLDYSADFTPDEWTLLHRAIRKLVAKNALGATTTVQVDQDNAIALLDHYREEQNSLQTQQPSGGDGTPRFVQGLLASLQGFVGDKRTMDPLPPGQPFEEYPSTAKLKRWAAMDG